ncbi:MAG: hypothetical protein FJY88_08085 [Candidatus Eisenbacteria bacterium]|nr:hypothetical protein [Candidatus Eisenbacteria bacterium]
MRAQTIVDRQNRLLLVLLSLVLPTGSVLGSVADSIRTVPSLPPVITEGPVDPNEYKVGPGDAFRISVLGQHPVTTRSIVSPEGSLAVPPAGAVPVWGLTLAEAREKILGVLSRYYHGVEVQVALEELRRFDIHVLGRVADPGTYVSNAMTRVSTAIARAGGFAEDASRRRIRVLGLDGSTRTADVVRFEMFGERYANPYVADGDLIQVPIRMGIARVHGEVALPGEYEIVENETLREIIEIAGGFMDDAVRDRVEVTRFLDYDPSRTRRFTVDFSHDPPRSEEPDLVARAGDEIFVRRIPQWQLHRGVSVEGEVLYPGVYVIDEGEETLTELVERAGGFTEDADLYEATLTRESFRSEAEDREFERLRLVPVADMTEDEYAYFKMRSRENKERVVVDFVALFRDGDLSKDILLRRADVIRVPQITRTITVSGQAVNPGRLPFREGASYKDYIRDAGGFARRASKGKVRVIKGVSGIWFDAGDTRLEPGDTVWIPEKPQRDYWELFKDFMTVAAQLATVYLVVDSASK